MSPHDLTSRERPDVAVPDFAPGGDFTLGAEDELLLVDHDGRPLGAAAEPVLARLTQQRAPHGLVTRELFVDEVELCTPVSVDAEGVHRSLRALRGSLAAHGVSAMGAGLHPEAAFGAARTTSSSRYDPIVAELAGLLRTPTAAFQVHVGLPDVRSALLAYRGLRNRLALFRALAATSPYWHGRDSGLASARTAITLSYPRTTAPPVLRSWEEHAVLTRRTVSSARLPDHTHVWWDLRPRPLLGTLEVRVMDAQPSLQRAAGLAALVQALARRAVEAPDAEDLPEDVVLANDFSAWRHGLDGTVVEPDGGQRPLRDVAARAVRQARDLLAPEGLDGPLDAVEAMLPGPTEAARQRRLVADRGLGALVADLVSRTGDLDG